MTAVKKDFIQFITEKYTLLTESEKMLSDYIIKNFDRVLTSSIHTLAKETDMSVATVVRFAKHLGFEGYKDFRLYLAQCGNEHEDFILDFSKNENSPDAQISRMLSSCAECLALTEKNLDYIALSRIAEKIHNAGKVAFFGAGTSYIVCQDAEIKFKRIGISTDCACEQNSASAILLNMKKGDVIFGISHSGNNEFVEAVLKTAREKGLITVAVTTFKNSKVSSLADCVLYTQTRESPLHKTAITSRVGQFAMMDSLFMTYLTAYYNECMENIQRLYEIRDGLNAIQK